MRRVGLTPVPVAANVQQGSVNTATESWLREQ